MVRPRLSKSRETVELKAALQLCDALIKQVEDAHLGRAIADARFFMEFMETAEFLSRSLDFLGIAVPNGLADCVESRLSEYEDRNAPTSLTTFCLPVYEGGFVLTGLIVPLVPLWLRHMREFRNTIAALTPGTRRRKPQSKGGRPKSRGTTRLETDLEHFVTEERARLQKNGMPSQQITERFSQYTWRDFVTGINDKYERTYELTDSTRKQVQRTDAWKTLQGITPPQASDAPIDDSLRRDHAWAAAEQLTPSSRMHQRTKLRRR
jgi:hypothetical protein